MEEKALYGMIEISLWIKLGHLQVFNGSHLTFFAYLVRLILTLSAFFPFLALAPT
ncbi:hypothetical protein DAI22_12g214401 [Oryza sativa Japonica Group]|nr:hypothetical protein DAI22_12g214401 [Oryza sativa Japonica Group]